MAERKRASAIAEGGIRGPGRASRRGPGLALVPGMEAHSSSQRNDDWDGAPMTRPMCPMHGTREVPHRVERDGVQLIEFACPVEECDHSWVVKRVRA